MCAQNTDKALVAIKSLRNIGFYTPNAKTILLEMATDKQLKPQIQVTAWAALKEVAQDQQVNRKALDTFQDQSRPDEVRIAAYKVAVEMPRRESIQQIITVLKRETSKQVGSYVSSHLENIQESANVHLRAIKELLQAENIPSDRVSYRVA